MAEEILQPQESIESQRHESLEAKELATLTRTAIDAALASGKIVSDFFYGKTPAELQIEYKADATPRTIADVEGDLAIVKIIQQRHPQDDIFIEESGYHQGVIDVNRSTEAKRRWYADSLDGTRPFTEGKPESTVGVVVCDENDNYLAAAIVHPGRKQIAFAARGIGAFMADIEEIDGEFRMTGKVRKLQVSQKTSLSGATVAVDSLFTRANGIRKHQVMSYLEEKTVDDQGKITLSYDMTGSNIAYQLEVARGASILGVTDAKGGNWDWRVGEAVVTEAGGVMLDGQTGHKPTNDSEIVIYGNKNIVEHALPITQRVYPDYQGFNQ